MANEIRLQRKDYYQNRLLKDEVIQQNNKEATTAPGVTDDSSIGYSEGSEWIDTTTDIKYTCTDATVGAAVWIAISDDVQNNYSGIGGPGSNDDELSGYSVGSIWIETGQNRSYICTDASAGNAIWVLSTAQAIHNFVATTDPTPNEDSSLSYSIGSIWINRASDEVFICADASVGAAAWVSLSDPNGAVTQRYDYVFYLNPDIGGGDGTISSPYSTTDEMMQDLWAQSQAGTLNVNTRSLILVSGSDVTASTIVGIGINWNMGSLEFIGVGSGASIGAIDFDQSGGAGGFINLAGLRMENLSMPSLPYTDDGLNCSFGNVVEFKDIRVTNQVTAIVGGGSTYISFSNVEIIGATTTITFVSDSGVFKADNIITIGVSLAVAQGGPDWDEAYISNFSIDGDLTLDLDETLVLVNGSCGYLEVTDGSSLNFSYSNVEAISVLLDSAPIGITGTPLVKYKTDASLPTANDDELYGYAPGSIWVDTSLAPNVDVYQCIDASTGAAVWTQLAISDVTDAIAAGVDIVQNLAATGTLTSELDISGESTILGDDFLAGAQSGGVGPYVNTFSITGISGPFVSSYLFTCPADGLVVAYVKTVDANGAIRVGLSDVTILDNANPC